jgi:hypothetical protein
LEIDAGGRQIVEQTHRAECRREQQRAAALASLPFRVAIRAPEEMDGREQDRRNDDQYESGRRIRVRIEAPVELAHAGKDDRRRETDRNERHRREPEERDREPVALIAADHTRGEVEHRRGDHHAEREARACPRECDLGLARRIHQRPRPEPQ